MSFKLWDETKNIVNGVKALAKTPSASKGRNPSPGSRRDKNALLIDLYQGVQEPQLEIDIKTAFADADEAKELLGQPVTLNIIKRLVNKTASLYKKPPKFQGNEDLVALLNDHAISPAKQADRLSELCGSCLVMVDWNYEDQEVAIRTIPPDQYELVWHPVKRDELQAVNLFSFTTDKNGDPVTLRIEYTADTFTVWNDKQDVTDEYLAQLGANANDGRVNPLGELPFVLMRPADPLWGEPEGVPRDDLGRAQRTVNMALTELKALLKNQAFSQLVVRGQVRTDIVTGLTSAVYLEADVGGNTGAEFITPDPKANELLETIRAIIRDQATQEGLGVTWADGGALPSGAALRVANADLEERRQDKEACHRKFWLELAEVVSRVSEVYGKKALDTTDFAIEFAPPEVYEDRLARVQAAEKELQLQLRSRLSLVKEFNPELKTDEEAQKFIDEAAAAEKSVRQAARPALPDANAFMQNPSDMQAQAQKMMGGAPQA